MTPHNITDILSTWASEAENGLTDSLDVYSRLYIIEKTASELKKEIFGQVESDIRKYGKETPERYGFKLTLSSRKSWSYSDPEIDRFKTLIKNREELAKRAYAMSQKGATLADENGEIVEPAKFNESQFVKMEKA